MDELEKLIREQEADMKNRDFQPKEPNTISLTPGLLHHISNHGYDSPIGMKARQRARWPECHLHGRKDLRLQTDTWSGWRCRICESEAARKYRSSDVVKEVLRERTKRWREDNPEKNRDYQREYKRRRWNEDPEWRERQLARQRAYRERRKASKEG